MSTRTQKRNVFCSCPCARTIPRASGPLQQGDRVTLAGTAGKRIRAHVFAVTAVGNAWAHFEEQQPNGAVTELLRVEQENITWMRGRATMEQVRAMRATRMLLR